MLGHSNLWVGGTPAGGGREGRGLAPWACQLVHQLQLPVQGALDQQGDGVKQLSVLGGPAHKGSRRAGGVGGAGVRGATVRSVRERGSKGVERASRCETHMARAHKHTYVHKHTATER